MEKRFPLKTKIFKQGLKISPKMSDDILALVEIPEEVILKIGDHFKDISAFHKEAKNVIREITEETGYNASKIAGVFLFVRFLGTNLQSEEQPEDMLDDIYSEGFINDKDLEVIKKKIRLIKRFIDLWRSRAKEARSESMGAPTYKGIAFSSNLRLQTEYPYESGSVEKKPPQVEKLIPMGLIEMVISTFSGEESISFQINIAEVEDLIRILIALKEELILLREKANSIHKGE